MEAPAEAQGSEYVSLGSGGTSFDALVHLLDRVAQSQASLGLRGLVALCIRGRAHDVYGVVRFKEGVDARVSDGVPDDCDAIIVLPAGVLLGRRGDLVEGEVKVAGDRKLIRRFTETFLQPQNPLTLRFMR